MVGLGGVEGECDIFVARTYMYSLFLSHRYKYPLSLSLSLSLARLLAHAHIPAVLVSEATAHDPPSAAAAAQQQPHAQTPSHPADAPARAPATHPQTARVFAHAAVPLGRATPHAPAAPRRQTALSRPRLVLSVRLYPSPSVTRPPARRLQRPRLHPCVGRGRRIRRGVLPSGMARSRHSPPRNPRSNRPPHSCRPAPVNPATRRRGPGGDRRCT